MTTFCFLYWVWKMEVLFIYYYIFCYLIVFIIDYSFYYFILFFIILFIFIFCHSLCLYISIVKKYLFVLVILCIIFKYFLHFIIFYINSSIRIKLCGYKLPWRVNSGNLTHKAEWKSHIKFFIISKQLKNRWPLWNKNTKMECKTSKKKHKATERDENLASLALKRMEMKDKTITEMKLH